MTREVGHIFSGNASVGHIVYIQNMEKRCRGKQKDDVNKTLRYLASI